MKSIRLTTAQVLLRFLSEQIIAIDDWDLPGQTSIGVRDRNGYLQRLISAEEKKPPDMPLISWGYHHYFHGKLSRYDLDKISLTRPIVVIHRSFHEFILNSVAMEILGIEESQFLRLGNRGRYIP